MSDLNESFSHTQDKHIGDIDQGPNTENHHISVGNLAPYARFTIETW